MSDIVTFTDSQGRTVSTTVGSARHLEHLATVPLVADEESATATAESVDEPESAEPAAEGEQPRPRRRRARSAES